MKFFYFFVIAFFFFSILFPLPVSAQSACPGLLDTKVNQDPVTGICYSESDPLYNPGLNTTGGARTCPVSCTNTPGVLPVGNTCVVQINGQCFAGHGPSGFNTPGCSPSSSTPLPKCPNPMALNIRVVDSTGNNIGGVTFTVIYADAPPSTQSAQIATAISDPLGTVSIQQLYSGDHFTIVPSSLYYTFSPTQIGNNNNLGQLEMNTTFPGNCGSSLENGTTLRPCVFVATRNNVPMPPSGQKTSGPIDTSDQTVNDTTTALTQTMFVLAAVGTIGYVVMNIGGSGRLEKDPYNNP